MTTNTFPTVTDFKDDYQSLMRDVIRVLSGAMRGKTNNISTVTLGASTVATDVALSKDVVSRYSYINFMPTTANAATEYAGGSLYVSSINDTDATVGTLNPYSIRISHTSTAQSDLIFQMVIIG